MNAPGSTKRHLVGWLLLVSSVFLVLDELRQFSDYAAFLIDPRGYQRWIAFVHPNVFLGWTEELVFGASLVLLAIWFARRPLARISLLVAVVGLLVHAVTGTFLHTGEFVDIVTVVFTCLGALAYLGSGIALLRERAVSGLAEAFIVMSFFVLVLADLGFLLVVIYSSASGFAFGAVGAAGTVAGFYGQLLVNWFFVAMSILAGVGQAGAGIAIVRSRPAALAQASSADSQ